MQKSLTLGRLDPRRGRARSSPAQLSGNTPFHCVAILLPLHRDTFASGFPRSTALGSRRTLSCGLLLLPRLWSNSRPARSPCHHLFALRLHNARPQHPARRVGGTVCSGGRPGRYILAPKFVPAVRASCFLFLCILCCFDHFFVRSFVFLCFSPLTFFAIRFSLVVLWYFFLFFKKKHFSVLLQHRQGHRCSTPPVDRKRFPALVSKFFLSFFSFFFVYFSFCFR